MIGPEKLSDIKRALQQELQADPKVRTWLNRKVKQASARSSSRSTVEEDLLWVQRFLEGETAKPASRPRTRKAAPKKPRKRTTVSS